MCDGCKAFKKELEVRRKQINETMLPALREQITRQRVIKHRMASGWNDPTGGKETIQKLLV